jgi:hypothetical protein
MSAYDPKRTSRERAIEAHEGMGGRVVEIDREIIARQILD